MTKKKNARTLSSGRLSSIPLFRVGGVLRLDCIQSFRMETVRVAWATTPGVGTTPAGVVAPAKAAAAAGGKIRNGRRRARYFSLNTPITMPSGSRKMPK